MNPDFELLLVNRTLRAFGFGFAAVLIGLQLERRGLSSTEVGAALSLGLLAAALSSFVAAGAARHVGNRMVLAVSGLLMSLTGLDLFLPTPHWLLQAAGLSGMLGAASVDLGPFSSVEQTLLAGAIAPGDRNRAFGRYALAGGLAAAAGSLLSSTARSDQAINGFFIAYCVIGLLTFVLPLLIAEEAQTEAVPRGIERPAGGLGTLSALFALDSLGGGFVVQAVIAYWLHARFGSGPEILGAAFAVIALLQAGSYEIAGRLADRFGLVRTMVFTHLPSNLLLLLVPFAPTLPIALLLLFARFSVSQMDVPARQAYVVSIVPPAGRAGAVALTGAVRGLGQAAGPLIAGAAIQGAKFGFPFYLAGALKIVYDLLLLALFRNRPASHEVGRRGRAGPPRQM